MSTTTTTTTAPPKTSKKAGLGPKKLTKPDKHAFEVSLVAVEKELREKEQVLAKARAAVNAIGGSKSPRNTEKDALRVEFDELKQKQAAIKASRGKVFDEISQIDTKIKKKVADLQAQRGKVTFKSAEEIDKHVDQLERSVEAGNLRLAEEKKVLKEITTLKKLRKNFEAFVAAQASIDEDKAKIAALKATVDDAESKTINARFGEIKAKFDEIRAESQKAYDNRNELYDARSAAQKEVDAVNQQIKSIKDQYYGKLRSFNTQIRQEIAERQERERADKEAAEKEKRRELAQEKLEIASEPAYAVQISTAKLLLFHFDPTFVAPDTNKDALAAPSAELGPANDGRTVELPVNATILKKEEEDFYSGSGKKKSKGKKKRDAGAASGSQASSSPADNKVVLDFTIVDQLASLKVAVPGSKDDVPKTVAELKDKLQYYIDNEERVTAERIARAKAEIAKMEADDAAEKKKKEDEEKEKKEEPAAAAAAAAADEKEEDKTEAATETSEESKE